MVGIWRISSAVVGRPGEARSRQGDLVTVSGLQVGVYSSKEKST